MANPSSSSATRAAHAGDDPFALLGLAPAFEVDLAALERAFFERSKATHPDRVAGASAAERVVALSRSRALNDAYQLIKKPVARNRRGVESRLPPFRRAGVAVANHSHCKAEAVYLRTTLNCSWTGLEFSMNGGVKYPRRPKVKETC